MKLTCPFMDEYVDSFSYSKNVELHVPHSRACQLEVSIMELHGFCGVKVSKTSGNIIKIISQTHVFWAISRGPGEPYVHVPRNTYSWILCKWSTHNIQLGRTYDHHQTTSIIFHITPSYDNIPAHGSSSESNISYLKWCSYEITRVHSRTTRTLHTPVIIPYHMGSRRKWRHKLWRKLKH